MPLIIQPDDLDTAELNLLIHYSETIIADHKAALSGITDKKHIGQINETIRYHEGKIREFEKKIKTKVPPALCDCEACNCPKSKAGQHSILVCTRCGGRTI